MARAAAAIELSEADDSALQGVLRASSSTQQEALRARIVLRAAEGATNRGGRRDGRAGRSGGRLDVGRLHQLIGEQLLRQFVEPILVGDRPVEERQVFDRRLGLPGGRRGRPRGDGSAVAKALLAQAEQRLQPGAVRAGSSGRRCPRRPPTSRVRRARAGTRRATRRPRAPFVLRRDPAWHQGTRSILVSGEAPGGLR